MRVCLSVDVQPPTTHNKDSARHICSAPMLHRFFKVQRKLTVAVPTPRVNKGTFGPFQGRLLKLGFH